MVKELLNMLHFELMISINKFPIIKKTEKMKTTERRERKKRDFLRRG